MLKDLVLKNRSYRGYDRSVKMTKEDLLELGIKHEQAGSEIPYRIR